MRNEEGWRVRQRKRSCERQSQGDKKHVPEKYTIVCIYIYIPWLKTNMLLSIAKYLDRKMALVLNNQVLLIRIANAILVNHFIKPICLSGKINKSSSKLLVASPPTRQFQSLRCRFFFCEYSILFFLSVLNIFTTIFFFEVVIRRYRTDV